MQMGQLVLCVAPGEEMGRREMEERGEIFLVPGDRSKFRPAEESEQRVKCQRDPKSVRDSPMQ